MILYTQINPSDPVFTATKIKTKTVEWRVTKPDSSSSGYYMSFILKTIIILTTSNSLSGCAYFLH